MESLYDPSGVERRWQQTWEAEGLYGAGAGRRRAETFVICIPPPNVTGELHLGHALNGAMQDVLIRWHRMQGFDTLWQVGFGGFAPGFAYLIGGDPRLRVPRRAEPRTRVPAGSVGLAGEFSGVYPRESPGGWQLVARTSERLWDLRRSTPALLTPGTEVRFVDD